MTILFNNLCTFYTTKPSSAGFLNYNNKLTKMVNLFLIVFCLILSWSQFYLIPNFSNMYILIENVLIVQAVFLNSDDSFGLCVLTVTAIVVTELLYYYFTGHHSYLYTKLIDDPEDIYWKSTPSGTSHSFFEYEISIYGIIIRLIVLVFIGYILSTRLLLVFITIKQAFLKANTNSILIAFIFIFPVVLFTSLSYFFPFYGFIVMTLFMLLLLPISFPFRINETFASFRSNLIDDLLDFLSKIGIVDFASTLSIIIFCQPKKLFRKGLFLGAIAIVMYALVSRWYYFTTIVKHQTLTGLTSSIVYVLLFIGLFFVYLRIIISLSFLIMNTAFLRKPALLPESVLYVLTGDERDHPAEPQYPRPNAPRPISLINIDRSRHYYRTYMENMPHNGKMFRYIGIGVGSAGVGAAAYAAYHTGLQTEELRVQSEQARIQTEQACIQSYELIRQNDLESVSQGLMSKEEYLKKHPNK